MYIIVVKVGPLSYSSLSPKWPVTLDQWPFFSFNKDKIAKKAKAFFIFPMVLHCTCRTGSPAVQNNLCDDIILFYTGWDEHTSTLYTATCTMHDD